MKKLFYTMILLFVASLSISAQEATLVPRVTKSGSAGIGEVNENNDVYIDTNTTLSVVATLPSVSGTNVKVKITVKKGNGEKVYQKGGMGNVHKPNIWKTEYSRDPGENPALF